MMIDENPNQNQSHQQDIAAEYTNYYQKGLELAEAGNYQDALLHIQQHLRTAPDDAQALNDTGAILYCLGQTEQAIEHFTKANTLKTNSPEIIWNLVEAYLAVGKANEAAQLFEGMQQMGILNPDVINRAAKVFLDKNEKGKAIQMLLLSLQISPKQEVLKPMIEVIRSKRPKITFICDSAHVTSLSEIYEFTSRRFQTHLSQGREELYELTNYSDICWFEQCSDLITEASKMPKNSKNIIRLSYLENHSRWLSQVNWQNIDIIITDENSSAKDILLEQIPDIQNRTRLITIPIGVNLERFNFTQKQQGRNIACVDDLDIANNPMFLLQCMQKLNYIDSEYKLFFAGNCENTSLQQYIRHMVDALRLTDVVFFDRMTEDISSWLQDKHYIVSCSIADSQNTSLLQAMACGLKPVIHNFPQASRIFPPEFLFNISEEFCQQILSDKHEPQRYRKFVEEKYPVSNQLNKINDIFLQFEAESDSQQIVNTSVETQRNPLSDNKIEQSQNYNPIENATNVNLSAPVSNNGQLDNF